MAKKYHTQSKCNASIKEFTKKYCFEFNHKGLPRPRRGAFAMKLKQKAALTLTTGQARAKRKTLCSIQNLKSKLRWPPQNAMTLEKILTILASCENYYNRRPQMERVAYPQVQNFPANPP